MEISFSTQPKTPKKLSDVSVEILNNRIADEYTAHYFYRNAANWCNDAGYVKAGAFFEGEAEAELGHAKKLQEYLIGWNVKPTMPSIKGDLDFDGLIDIVNKAYNLEYSLMEKYNEDSLEILNTDLTTFDFLQEFRTIQRGEVFEYADLLNGAALVDVTNKLDVLYFENQYFGG